MRRFQKSVKQNTCFNSQLRALKVKMSPPTVKKRATKSVDQKYAIIKAYSQCKNDFGCKTKLIKDFNLPSISSLNTISATTMARKRLTKGDNPLLDDCLYEWFLSMRANKVEISGEDIVEQSKLIAERLKIENFLGSRGYLQQKGKYLQQKFKERYNIKFRILHGEGGKVDENTVATWGNTLKFITDTDPRTFTIGMKLACFSPKDVTAAT